MRFVLIAGTCVGLATVAQAQSDVAGVCNRLAFGAYTAAHLDSDLVPLGSSETLDWIPMGAIAAVSTFEGQTLSDPELRLMTFVMAHMMAGAMTAGGTFENFVGICHLGVTLGAYNITDEQLIDMFFPE